MELEKDFKELLKLFNKNKVRYCVVGAYAVAFYSKPRYSKDIDLLVEPDLENGKKIIKSLREFGFSSLKLKPEDFEREGAIIQLGYEPVRVDLLTSISGSKFKEIWRGRKTSKIAGQKIIIIGFRELIKSKKISNRPIDKIDVDYLLKFKNKRSR
ncbi:MAG: hypothetical protein AB1755_01775 [Candidatus Omnitrophota bacterium]